MRWPASTRAMRSAMGVVATSMMVSSGFPGSHLQDVAGIPGRYLRCGRTATAARMVAAAATGAATAAGTALAAGTATAVRATCTAL